MQRRVFIAAAGALVLAGCVTPQNALPPEIELSNVGLLSSGIFSQNIELELRLRNPNNFSLPLDALTYNLELNGAPFVRGRSDESVTIPALGDVLYPIKASTSVLDLLQQAFNLSTSGMSYRVNGIAYLGRFFPQGVPYDKSGRIGLFGGTGGSGGTAPGTGGGTRTLKPL
jgi:LEA14-like dessication related protein